MVMAAEKVAPLPLSVSVEENHAPAADPPFLGVRDVIIWALLNAGCAAISIALRLIVTHISHPPPRWLLQRRAAEPDEELTDAEIHLGFVLAMMWYACVVSQAAAGSLALPRRHRLLLACAALVATTAGHGIWAGLFMIFAPGALSFWIGVNTAVMFFSGVVDLLCFRGLILGGGEEEE